MTANFSRWFPTKKRLHLAQETWKQGNGAIIFIAKAPDDMHGVSKSTLRDRIKGTISKTEASQKNATIISWRKTSFG